MSASLVLVEHSQTGVIEYAASDRLFRPLRLPGIWHGCRERTSAISLFFNTQRTSKKTTCVIRPLKRKKITSRHMTAHKKIKCNIYTKKGWKRYLFMLSVESCCPWITLSSRFRTRKCPALCRSQAHFLGSMRTLSLMLASWMTRIISDLVHNAIEKMRELLTWV